MMMSSGEEETEIFSMHDKSLSNAPGGNVIKSLGKRRSRQRVDAGEPRNSYASIPNFSSRPPQSSLTSVANTSNNTGHLFNGFGGAAKMLNDLNGRALIGAAEPEMAVVEGARKMNGDNEGNVYALHDSFNHRLDKAHLLRDMLQASATNKGSSQLSKFLNSAGRPSRTPSPNEEVSSDRGNSPIDGRCVIVSCEEEVMRRRAGGMEDAKNIGVAKCDQMAPSSTDPTNNDDGTSLLVKSPVHSQLIVDELVSKSDSCSGRNYSALPSRCSIIESTRPDNRQNIFDSRDVHSRPRNMGDDVASSDDASGQHLTASSTPLERHSTTTTMMNGGSSPTHALPTPSPEPSSSPIESLSDNHLIDRSSPIRSSDSPVQQKRARVENIVTSMLVSNTSQGGHQQVNGCKKRKQYQPQQHESVNARSSNCESEEEDEYEQEWPRMKHRKVEKESLEGQLKWMQEQLTVMQEKYNSLLTTSCGNDENGSEADNRGSSTINANDAEDSESSNEKPTPDVTEDEEDDDAKDSEDTDKGKEKQSLANKTHYNHSMHSSEGLIDPSLFIDEARRLVSEQQERIAKENETIVTGTSEPQPQAQNLQCKERNASANANRHTPNNVNNTHIQQTANAAALLSNVVEFIKLELSSSLPRIVDMIVANYIAHQPRSVVLQAQKMISETSPMANKDYYSNVDRKSPRTKVSDRGRIANGMQTPTSGSGASMNSMSKDASSPMCRPYGERSPHIKSSSGAVFPTIAKMPTAPLNIMFGGGLPTSSHPSPNLPPFSQGTTNNSSSSQTQSSLIPESSPEQTEAMSLVIPAKKKRTKVTDTRPSSRSIRGFGQEADSPNSGAGKYMFPFSSGTESSPSNFHPASLTPIVPSTLPTSVAIPNPSLHQSDIFSAASGYPFEHSRLSVGNLESSRLYREDSEISRTPSSHHLTLQQHLLMTSHNTPSDIQSIRSFQSHHAKGDLNSRDSENGNDHHLNSSHLGSSDGISSPYDNGVVALSSTLTPMHLRKAKLMFFYVRYPSSAVLKTFFPDIKFNKNNTAQLVKWFSNFREFYYIQMEKYARQAISEGIKNSDDISVSTDSEIYRILNLHYNRNNHIEVPPNFRYIVEQSLREFFKAVHAGKDTEQSWKKAIYKVIARLDDNVPEYFKSPNFLEQLE